MLMWVSTTCLLAGWLPVLSSLFILKWCQTLHWSRSFVSRYLYSWNIIKPWHIDIMTREIYSCLYFLFPIARKTISIWDSICLYICQRQYSSVHMSETTFVSTYIMYVYVYTSVDRCLLPFFSLPSRCFLQNVTPILSSLVLRHDQVIQVSFI